MRVLAFVKYNSQAASTRQRFVQYEPYLAASGIQVDYSVLLDDSHMKRLIHGEAAPRFGALGCYARRVRKLLAGRDYDVLWIHSEFFPYLPAFAERLALVAGGRPIVLDFDDAIFHMYDANPRRPVRWLLGNKLAPLLRRAEACCCGNEYVQAYALAYCSNSILLPTVVDTDAYRPADRAVGERRSVTIGWIGSPSTWSYMRPLLPLLRKLVQQHDATIKVVGAGRAAEQDRFPGLDLRDWTEDSEIAEVQSMDVGIMPVPDDLWARGKSGYKLIQYMACGLPVVASPVGVNSQIVEHGKGGFLAAELGEWRSALIKLVEDEPLRRRMGAVSRRRADDLYSLRVHAPRLVDVFKSVQQQHKVPR